MNRKKLAVKTAKIVGLSLLAVVVILFSVINVVHWYVHRADIPVELSTAADIEPSPSRPMPADLLADLQIPDKFQLRYKVSDIPVPVRVAFAKAAHEDAFSMADPGERWEATDVIGWPYFPQRRLMSAAFTDSFWLVFYEQGGFGESRNVAIFRLSSSGAELVGHMYYPGMATPTALLQALKTEATIEQAFYLIAFSTTSPNN